MSAALQLSMVEPDVAHIVFDTPDKSANILSASVLDELEVLLDNMDADSIVGLVISSAKPGIFIAGADLREFVQSLDIDPANIEAMCRRGQQLFQRLSEVPYVTIAAIAGVCVGGGAELASWCDRRVFADTSKTEYGFPEVKLGIFPGWGGTVRAPRIVGLSNAVEMITGGESIDVATAQAMRWADDVTTCDDLVAAAVRMVRDEQQTQSYLRDRDRRAQPIRITETELGFLGATASAMIQQQTKGHYPAPMAALETMLESSMCDAEQALQMEATNMSQLFGSPVNAALLNVFFLTDRIKKDRGVGDDQIEPRTLDSASILGAGIMGSGIAAAHLKRGVKVTLTDTHADALAKGEAATLEEASYDRKTKSASSEKLLELTPRLHATQNDEEIASSDLVIEAVVENIDIKRSVLQRLEPLMGENAILASNTSTIPITQLAEGLQHPDRFCGIHFFNPVRRMKLVEVIRGEQTSDETTATAVAHAKRIGKLPIVVNDGPGFLVNRLLFPYMNEAVELLCEGVAMKQIDRASKAFGMPMGPIELYDMVGIDTAVFAGSVMAQAFPDRMVEQSPVLEALVAADRLGRKTGKGFFSYENRKKRAEEDAAAVELIAPHINQTREVSAEEITHRLFLPMLLEATRALQDGIVRDVRDVDFGLIYGIGFPPFKGGILHWADTVGAAAILDILKPFEALGARMAPTEMILELAESNRKFYG